MNTVRIATTVNGIRYERDVEARRLLVDFLREDLDLVGTHVGCEHGVCGTCTVLMGGESIRSCITFAVQADGQAITTVEGLVGNGEMHPLQEAFWEKQGLQCGYCTPGMLITAQDLLHRTERSKGILSRQAIREHLSGNYCRCTGYQAVIDAVEATARRRSDAG
jgi:carbon-monoxide dehydrogenase small subunit